MRHLRLCRFSLLALALALALLVFNEIAVCQSRNKQATWSSANVQLLVNSKELTLTVPLAHPIARKGRAHVELKLINPDDLIRAQLSEDFEIAPKQKQIVVRLAAPFKDVPLSEMEALHWLRVRYMIRTDTGELLASGVEPLRASATDPFILTAAASRVAAEGRPYRVQVHVKANDGHPMGGVQVEGKVTWDEDNEKTLTARSSTNAAGNASLEFSIPTAVSAETGELEIGVKSGLVVRVVEREVEFSAASYLLLDTDKDIYQPGQTLHARLLRFDSKRKAVENETLDVRIDDEENTLVSKQTVATDAFGVAHLDWEVPANVRQGNYQIHAAVSGQEDTWRHARATKFVRIYRYDLPNFRVEAKPDRTYYLPGQNAEVAVSAEYLFGKPVTRGTVRVVEESERSWNFRKQAWETNEGQVHTGELDRDGRFVARFDLSKGQQDFSDHDYYRFRDVDVAAYVTDLTTGRTEQRRFALRVTKDPIHVYIDDVTTPSDKMPSSFHISTFYADGTPARCKVRLSLYDDSEKPVEKLPLRTVETNKYGLAKVTELKIPKDDDRDSLLAEATDAKGLAGHYAETFYGRDDDDLGIVNVATSHAIHKAGDPIEVTLRSTRPHLRLVVQAVREGVVLATQQTTLHKGQGYLVFPYDARFTDEVTVFAFSLEEEWSPTVLLEGVHTVLYPKNRQLGVAVKFDKNEYRPGADASARIAVQFADKTGAESALGVNIVDRAVGERARTDTDFGQGNRGTWWRWSLWWSGDRGFGGISREDLDQIDLSQPVPEDLDLVADYILQSGYSDMLQLLEGQSSLTAGEVFSRLLKKQFEPLDTALQGWNERGKTPRDGVELAALGQEAGIDVLKLLDPWGTPYRYELQYQGYSHSVSATSAGPDKQFGTQDDFIAHQTDRKYFLYYGKILESVSNDLMSKEGRFIRDHSTLQAEMLKRGVDFDALRDPWGKPYEVRFVVLGSFYITQIVSHGQDSAPAKEGGGAVVWEERVNYFAKSRENINKVLTGNLNAGGAYPSNETEFKAILRKAGVNLDELHDPWGNPYYVVFRKLALYSDRVKIQQRTASGERVGEPVTMVRQEVRVLSDGPDGKLGNDDDVQVASYSMLVSEQSAKDMAPRPAPAAVNLIANTGAITGTVVDPTGATIMNATVEATREQTDEKYTAKTDYRGQFELKDLPPGVYDVKAYASGFRGLEVTAVPVQSMSMTDVGFELSVGSATEMVTVEAASVQLETSSSSIAGRDVSDLVTLVPGLSVVTKSGAMTTPRLRQDFPETMLWEPALITDRRGHAKLNFKMADNITTWKLTAVASTKTGELGRTEVDLRAFQPFFVEHDPPRILTQGDEISYPVVLRNYLDRSQTLKASIKPEPWFTLLGPTETTVKVDAGDSARAVFRYRTVAAVLDGKQQVSAANAEIGDAAQKPVDVHPFGRPTSVTATGVIDRKGTLTLHIPDDVIAGSVRARVKVYPNLLAHVVENLEAGLQKPHGCGEQTISSTYPSLLVAEIYSKSEHKPPVALKAQRYLGAGYERLLRYQSESGGFSYWGHGEEADLSLTAYAVEFLHHAATLIAVDEGVMQNAERWILGQQGPDGSWRGHWQKNDQNALLVTAYIARTLAQIEVDDTGKKARQVGLEKALAFLSRHRDLADEPYVIASYALAAQASGNGEVAGKLLESLRKNVHREAGAAYWALERNTPFYGWGRPGLLESTALAVQALVAGATPDSLDESLIRQGLIFLLHNQDKDGMWYCGQTTVHVLRTLLSLVTQRERDAATKLSVRVNGKQAEVVDLPAGQVVVAPVELDVTSFIVAGENQVELESASEGMMSAQFVAESYLPWGDEASVASKPAANATSTLRFAVEYSKTQATTDDKIECHVRAERVGYAGYGMMLGEVGLPPGAEVDRESLERAVQGNYSVYRYEVQPDRVILYLWPQAGGSEFTFQFRPRFAMSAQSASSLLYDYYNPEASVTLKPTRFDIGPGREQ